MADTRKIGLKTPLGETLLIRAATVTEHLAQPFEIDLELLSADENIELDDLIGHEITLSVGLDDGESRYFHAFVIEFGYTGRLGTYATYSARAVPWLWFLTRTADCRIFQNKSAPDIVKSIFKEHGYTDVKDSLTKTYRTRDYCVQYRETDFNFVQRLMEEEGIYYYFKHTDSTHTLVLADSYSGHEPFPGYKTIEYFPPSENAIREADHIHDWRLSRNVQPGKYVVMDYDFTKPRAVLKTQYVQKRDFPKSDAEMFDYPGGFTVTADGDHYARARLESLQAQYERMRGAGNARGLAVGSLFELTGYPRRDQNKEYLIAGAVHRLHAGDYESGMGGASEDYSCTFEAVASKEPYRAAMTTQKPLVGGPQTATVVGPGGEEIFTDKYGRVKVQFHWDREGQRDDKSSCWVRVSQIWAGKNWGWMSIPRIGQEVVVDFLEGDPDQPIITGRVYNADNMPPFELPANKTQSGLRTRSTLNGTAANCNELRFEDKKGSEQLYIHAEKNQDIEVEANETHWVGHDRAKTVDHDETTHVKHDRTETVDNNETITIGADRTESVGSNESITIGTNRTESVGSNETVSIGSSRSLSVGTSESISVGSDQSTSVGANRTVDVGGNQSVTIGGDHTVSVGKDEQASIGKSRSVDIGTDDALKVGKTLVIDVADKITIQTGSASITMKKDGTITIKGKDITLEGSGKINVKASSDVTIKGSKVAQN